MTPLTYSRQVGRRSNGEEEGCDSGKKDHLKISFLYVRSRKLLSDRTANEYVYVHGLRYITVACVRLAVLRVCVCAPVCTRVLVCVCGHIPRVVFFFARLPVFFADSSLLRFDRFFSSATTASRACSSASGRASGKDKRESERARTHAVLSPLQGLEMTSNRVHCIARSIRNGAKQASVLYTMTRFVVQRSNARCTQQYN